MGLNFWALKLYRAFNYERELNLAFDYEVELTLGALNFSLVSLKLKTAFF